MTHTQPNPGPAAAVIPFGIGEPFTVDTYVAGESDDPDDGDIALLQVARGTLGINVGRYSWNFAEAERLALAMIAACAAGREGA